MFPLQVISKFLSVFYPEEKDKNKEEVKPLDIPCAAQSNGYDCGVFLVLFTEILADSFRCALSACPPTSDVLSVSQADVSKKRAELSRLILSLAEEEKKNVDSRLSA